MGIMTQIISRDNVAWAFHSTGGDLSLFLDRNKLFEMTMGRGREFQYISTAIHLSTIANLDNSKPSVTNVNMSLDGGGGG